MEFNSSLALQAAGNSGGKITRGKAERMGFPDGAFDAVTMIHVLEHMDNPIEVLGEVRRVLRPQGLLHIAIPCLDVRVRALLMRIPSESLRRKAFRIMEIGPPDHLLHFPAATLRDTVERLGFEIVDHVFVNNRFPFSVPNPIIRAYWLISKVTSPLLKMLGSGFHYEVLARR